MFACFSPSLTTPSKMFSPISALTMLERLLELKDFLDDVEADDDLVSLSASLDAEDDVLNARLGLLEPALGGTGASLAEDGCPITALLILSHWTQDRLNQSVVLAIVPPRARVSVKYFCSKSMALSSSQGRMARS